MKLFVLFFLTFCIGILFSNASAQTKKPELYLQTGHSDIINNVALSADGKLLVSGADDGLVKLWDAVSRTELRTFDGGFSVNVNVAISADGRLVSAVSENIIKVWEIETAKEVAAFTYISKVKIREKGESYTSNRLNGISFDPSGNILSATALDGNVLLWDFRRNKLLHTLTGHKSWTSSAVFSPDGKTLASSSGDKTIILWDVETGKKLRVLKGHSEFVFGVTFNQDGSLLASASDDKTSKLWNLADGKEIKTFTGHEKTVGDVKFLNNEGILLTSSEDRTIKLWNIETGRIIKTLSGFSGSISSFVVSPDNRTIMSSSFDNIQITYWNIETGVSAPIYSFATNIMRVEFSDDFNKMAICYPFETIVWNLVEGIQTRIDFHQDGYYSPAAFSPDGNKFAFAGLGDVKVWDVSSGKELKTFPHTDEVATLQFNADGSLFVSQTFKREKNGSLFFTIWNIETGKKVLETNDFDKVSEQIPTAKILDLNKTKSVFNNDKLRAEAKNATIIIYDNQTNQELLSMIQLPNEKSWIVMTPDGLFDGSSKAWKNLFWRFDDKTFDYAPVEAFFKEFYRPGLLQDIFAGNPVESPTQDLSKIDIRQPFVNISEIDGKPIESSALLPGKVSADKKTVRVKVEITDNASEARPGIMKSSSDANDLRLFRNGSLVRLWKKANASGTQTSSVFDLTEKDGCAQFAATKDTPRKAVCETKVQITSGENNFTAYAFNHENVKSTDAPTVTVKGEFPKKDGTLYVLAIGVNKYKNASYNLNFAVPDVVDIGKALTERQAKFSGQKQYSETKVITLTDETATKENILRALDLFSGGDKNALPENTPDTLKTELAKIAPAQPEDAVLIYFAGHGVSDGGRFYLLPHDFTGDADLLEKQSVSDLELNEYLEKVDAGKILMAIDACQSGSALGGKNDGRAPMNSKGFAQLAYDKGMYILTAAQSYQAALEVSKTPTGQDIKHGLLTYSLLEGLNDLKADADDDKQITEREWFSFAVAEVPKMQLEALKTRSGLVIVSGDDKDAKAEDKRLQTPRMFYKRETEANPFIVAK